MMKFLLYFWKFGLLKFHLTKFFEYANNDCTSTHFNQTAPYIELYNNWFMQIVIASVFNMTVIIPFILTI